METMQELISRVIPSITINTLENNSKYVASRTKKRSRALAGELQYLVSYPSNKSRLQYLKKFEKVSLAEFLNILRSKAFKASCVSNGNIIVKMPSTAAIGQENDLSEEWEILSLDVTYSGVPNIGEIKYQDYLDWAETITCE